MRSTRNLFAFITKVAQQQFKEAKYASPNEMVKAYSDLMAPYRQLKERLAQLESDSGAAEMQLLAKNVSESEKSSLTTTVQQANTEVAEVKAKIVEISKEVDVSIFEKAISELSTGKALDTFFLVEEIGGEMNELKVTPTPAIVQAFRSVYFGDSSADNSELLFRLVERPAQSFVTLDSGESLNAQLGNLLEKEGTEKFDKLPLDKNRLKSYNEDIHQTALLETLKGK
eukprot:NODE_4303_length_831_cov_45.708440_g3975_i0.p1 GENE.NODE_4303_length_831_cov_45.708440_g3975_i0~~NODE_4303_length_831_cov_45.708440_g3975_i0.p1  ORF type:complete len:228 (-),score=45.39 NODE_4303_length_831_cov_45.708440_g3975_i0:84-767(-)